jgi:hypothetical protein
MRSQEILNELTNGEIIQIFSRIQMNRNFFETPECNEKENFNSWSEFNFNYWYNFTKAETI